MIRSLLLFTPLILLAACAEERRVVRDNSAETKFIALFGGKNTGDGSGAFAIVRGGAAPPRTTALSRSDAPPPSFIAPPNPPGWHVSTSFQTDEQPAATRPADPAARTVQQMSPWGVMPNAPGN